jgi:hypothetical protein
MDFSVCSELRTVRGFLEEKDALALLEDPDTVLAIDVVSNAVGYGEQVMCVCVCVCVCVCINTYIHTYILTYLLTNIHTYI